MPQRAARARQMRLRLQRLRALQQLLEQRVLQRGRGELRGLVRGDVVPEQHGGRAGVNSAAGGVEKQAPPPPLTPFVYFKK